MLNFIGEKVRGIHIKNTHHCKEHLFFFFFCARVRKVIEILATVIGHSTDFKMDTHLEKSFYILGFYSTKCAITSTRTATAMSISKRHEKFVNTGCICKGNSLCRPTTSADTVERVSHAYLRISGSQDVGLAGN